MPVYFPDDFGTCREGDHDVVVVWLVPVSRSEAAIVHQQGWNAPKDRCVEADRDLSDV